MSCNIMFNVELFANFTADVAHCISDASRTHQDESDLHASESHRFSAEHVGSANRKNYCLFDEIRNYKYLSKIHLTVISLLFLNVHDTLCVSRLCVRIIQFKNLRNNPSRLVYVQTLLLVYYLRIVNKTVLSFIISLYLSTQSFLFQTILFKINRCLP